MIPSLTVGKKKNRCIPVNTRDTAIFTVVSKYSNLFFPFAFFLNSSHFTFCYELIICSEATDFIIQKVCAYCIEPVILCLLRDPLLIQILLDFSNFFIFCNCRFSNEMGWVGWILTVLFCPSGIQHFLFLFYMLIQKSFFYFITRCNEIQYIKSKK